MYLIPVLHDRLVRRLAYALILRWICTICIFLISEITTTKWPDKKERRKRKNRLKMNFSSWRTLRFCSACKNCPYYLHFYRNEAKQNDRHEFKLYRIRRRHFLQQLLLVYIRCCVDAKCSFPTDHSWQIMCGKTHLLYHLTLTTNGG